MSCPRCAVLAEMVRIEATYRQVLCRRMEDELEERGIATPGWLIAAEQVPIDPWADHDLSPVACDADIQAAALEEVPGC